MRRLLTALVVLAVLLAVADRVAAAVAAQTVAGRIRTAASLTEDPKVTFHDVPFLTQAVAGRYRSVQVRADEVDLGRIHGVVLDVHLTGVRLPLRDVLHRRIGAVPVDQVTGTATIGYPDLLRAAEVPDGARVESLRPAGDGLVVRGTVEMLGRSLTATARASVRVEQGTLVVTATRVSVPDLPADLPRPAGLLGFRVRLGELPFGLQVTGVRAGERGLSVSAQAHDVVLNTRHPAGALAPPG